MNIRLTSAALAAALLFGAGNTAAQDVNNDFQLTADVSVAGMVTFTWQLHGQARMFMGNGSLLTLARGPVGANSNANTGGFFADRPATNLLLIPATAEYLTTANTWMQNAQAIRPSNMLPNIRNIEALNSITIANDAPRDYQLIFRDQDGDYWAGQIVTAAPAAAALELTGGVLQFTADVTFTSPGAFALPTRLWLSTRAGANCGGANVDANGNIRNAQIVHLWENAPPDSDTVTITHRGMSTSELMQGAALTPGFYCAQIVSADPNLADGKSPLVQVEVNPPPMVTITSAAWNSANTGIVVQWEFTNFDASITYILQTCAGENCDPGAGSGLSVTAFTMGSSQAPTSARMYANLLTAGVLAPTADDVNRYIIIAANSGDFENSNIITVQPPAPMVTITSAAWNSANTGIVVQWEFTNFDASITYILQTCAGENCDPGAGSGLAVTAFTMGSSQAPTSARMATNSLAHSNSPPTPGAVNRYIIYSRLPNAFPDSNIFTVQPPDAPAAIIAAVSGTQTEGTPVELDGSGSTAHSGDTSINSYRWTQVTTDNPNTATALAEDHANYVELSGATTDMASFTVPERFAAGFTAMLHFSLVVTDGDGSSEPAYVSVMVAGANDPPTTPVITIMHTPPEEGARAIPLDVESARIAPSIPAMGDTAALNSRVVLTASGSDDVDTGDAISTYTWTQVTAADATGLDFTLGPETAAATNADDSWIDLTTSDGVPRQSGEVPVPAIPAGITASFTAPAFVKDDGTPTAAGMMTNAAGEMVPRTTPLMLHFRVVADDGEDAESEPAWVTITVVPPSTGGDTAAVDRAILPHVIRALERQVHNSIYQRIQQRQREDGKWK